MKWRPTVRRLAWRIGRRVYCEARGEPSHNNPQSNGEIALARAVVEATHRESKLTMLDVGANLGDWTLPVLDLLPQSRCEPARLQLSLFEPVPTIRSALIGNLSRHPRGSLATVHSCALSDGSGIARMAVFGTNAGTNSLVLDEDAQRRAETIIDVERLSLPEFASQRGIDRINLMKVDTEGHDLSVLRGARPLLALERIDVVQFEYNHRWIGARAYLKDVFALIDGLPYRLGRVMPHHVEVFDGWHFELERYFEANYCLVHTSALDWLDVRYLSFDGSNTYA